MKFSGEFVSLAVPFLNLGANLTGRQSPSLQLRDQYGNISYGSQTWSSSAPLHTHHHHNHEHHRERLRPRAGDASMGLGTQGGETSAECPQPPVLSCSPQAASADTCCVRLNINQMSTMVSFLTLFTYRLSLLEAS